MKILIADDHLFVADAVRDTLAEIEPAAQFVIAQSVEELFALADGSLNLAIVDLNMPGVQGHEHVDELLRRHPSLPVIVLSGFGDAALMQSLLAQGVRGFIPKAYPVDVMATAVRLVLAGSVYVPPAALSALPFNGAESSLEKPHGSAAPGPAVTLTPRQMDVLERLIQGKPNKLIARELGITEATVKMHMSAIFLALGARNRTEAVLAARQISPRAS
jgi:DNA-binding NarL/FixJ family response regulator